MIDNEALVVIDYICKRIFVHPVADKHTVIDVDRGRTEGLSVRSEEGNVRFGHLRSRFHNAGEFLRVDFAVGIDIAATA